MVTSGASRRPGTPTAAPGVPWAHPGAEVLRTDAPTSPPGCQDAAVAHYAEAFSVDAGRCFRYVDKPGCVGQPMRCRAPVAGRVRFRDGRGRPWTVDACVEHAGELVSAQRS